MDGDTSNIKSLKFQMIVKLCLGFNKETYSALWSKGCICDWNKDKFNWNRKIKKVALVNFEYNIIDFYRVLKEKEQYKLYGISKDPTSHSYILVFDDEVYNQNLCVKCQILSNFFYWCKSCKLNHFQLNYGEFPSGNDEIDNILKDHYYDSISPKELIEWIPFNEFREIVLTADNKEIYNALWSKGCIYDWDEDKLSWIREVKKVTLVNFKCSINDFNIMVLKEKLYGISKDPTSHSYILVLDDEGYNQNLCINCQILSSFFDWLWLKGCICDWDKDKFSWNRKIRKVIAVKFKCGFDTTIKALVEKEGFKIYGISKDLASPNYILVLDQILCIKCQGHGYFDWCKRCKLIKFQLSYGEYPSGNNDIDNFLKENCCESKFDNELIEWISYIELEDITYITIREDSSIKYYTAERNRMVLTLMEFENLNDLLNYKNKMQINMKKEHPEPFKSYIIHGISKNPISLNYILVFEYSQDFLNFLNEPKDYQIIGISKDEKYKYNLVTYLKNFSHFLCSDCKPRKALFFNWCDDCKIEHFSHNYSDLPRFLQEVQSYCKIGFSHKITKLYVHLLNKCWDETPLNRPTANEIIQKLIHFETDDIIFEELRNYNNGILKQYSESTSKLGHLKTLYNSELHITKAIEFTELSQ
ncbi:unnamed protein product [Rhizophagus irregularis]|uniref:Serine-threonine/tyrosine-protein kinase catalytic domain-containing protein n=1 Tax=Rhizophagus irregularis TaxID=588596 RepID=A0A915Z5R3_9GLOM|nr:unnamed protein product [Rhizophagus irregularis]